MTIIILYYKDTDVNDHIYYTYYYLVVLICAHAPSAMAEVGGAKNGKALCVHGYR